ncbi:unnamed protein product [Cylicocyclus nassatus]|uniref:Uncharacterized protein n=1 Tax=Cylicocyclus nassatus TaxID=53992 RepID=A0AA36M0F2_CYLNA|nr:unnamed protein product [Cylicocyclus nassatus]
MTLSYFTLSAEKDMKAEGQWSITFGDPRWDHSTLGVSRKSHRDFYKVRTFLLNKIEVRAISYYMRRETTKKTLTKRNAALLSQRNAIFSNPR